VRLNILKNMALRESLKVKHTWNFYLLLVEDTQIADTLVRHCKLQISSNQLESSVNLEVFK
jgi:hypothetical protein